MNNQLKSILLLGALAALVAGLGAALAPGYAWFFLAGALAMNLGAWFFSDRMVLAMSGAREASREAAPGLHAVVEELAERANLPKLRVMIVEDGQPNAFATGRTPEKGVVAVTTGLLALLDTRELRGVVAHELAHIKNRDVLVASIAAAAASCVTWIANLAGFGLRGGASQLFQLFSTHPPVEERTRRLRALAHAGTPWRDWSPRHHRLLES